MRIREYENMVQIDSLQLGNDVVMRTPTARNLGVIIDSHLSLEQQVNDVRKKCYYYLKWIKVIRPYISAYVAKVLVQALVIGRLDYCNALYIGLPKYLLQRLQAVQNAAARVITKCARDDSISEACKTLHWLPVEQRVSFKIDTLVYKALHDSAPNYVSSLVKIKDSRRTLRSSDTQLLEQPKANMKYGERAFSIAGPREWNKLPVHIRTAKSFMSFRKQLKTHLFRI